VFDLPGKGLRLKKDIIESAMLPSAEEEKKRISVKLEIVKEGREVPTMARARLEALFDDDTFEEIGAKVRHRANDFGLEKKRPEGDGVITGSGEVNGRIVFAFAQDRSVMGGSLGEAHAQKICRIMDMAHNAACPLVAINDSGGARIQEGIDSLGGYGEIFRRNVAMSGIVPQISLIMGPCAGGAVYSPALTDFIAMVQSQSYMFLTGPKVVKTVTFEDVTPEKLGGADVHARQSGVSHLLYRNEADAIHGVRQLLSYLPSNWKEQPPHFESGDPVSRDAEELNSIIPENPREVYNAYGIVNSVLDHDSFFEIHKTWARNIITGFGRIGGYTVGIVANQPLWMAGVLDSDASRKGARFIRACNAFNIPIVTFVDVPGFMPGTHQEHQGIIYHGAKLCYAYCEATVPKVTIITRKAYGGAYIVMGSKHIGGDVNLAWPSAEVAVMGAHGAVEILFRKEIEKSDDPGRAASEKIEEYEQKFLNPERAAERGYVDNVILPSETRAKVYRHLKANIAKQQELPQRRNGNIPT